MFTNIHLEGKYDSHAHIAAIIALLGPPPKELVVREREGRAWKWRHPIENASGQLCDNASAYYGGPFFDSQGTI